ncbi:MAG: ABC transporter [Deltaproteobacteria bacterium CG_4_9_14_3_um_filter_44_9]|nr:MAG: ABC transporter [Deltaproteobacteria bacterium CG2_30_43_15]PIU86554.1 MAG: ABC transporter [Deltaproteobacteria bacterium CG06_land_8_20_14_3_00_44_19]PIX25255.1 MAG: ABC transporter [Deltaproteobacteria bacterium CG_4_8_14_3_um_filter_43_13]PIZ19218.1 MAG: ABC transporter [Deltaproteobacteria bacterium CG_4_10_14_0_8_um_filter_43_12]PJB45240.1 MAG: ABC transporter [Deltaproteobacteria bacterium CG_4_9_14_3_um_filter_44_9]HCX90996.1 ABC transporter [Deltaproteobacteria bacterium]
MIQLIDLTKKYSKVKAIDGINLEIKQGEIFGFLGPNGAGKTTTIKIMVGLLKPTSGRVIIDGNDIAKNPLEAKKVVGFIPDRPFLYEKLTGKEFLRFMAGLYSIDTNSYESKISELLELFELTEWGDELIEGYSHGMQQRLVMSSALIHNPKVIIVDEPMVGLDPKGARLVKEIFKAISLKGTTIFMSTHTLEIAEEMCDRIAIIQEGKVIALGTMDELRKKVDSTGDQGLESVFLVLTGGEEMREIIDVLKR